MDKSVVVRVEAGEVDGLAIVPSAKRMLAYARIGVIDYDSYRYYSEGRYELSTQPVKDAIKLELNPKWSGFRMAFYDYAVDGVRNEDMAGCCTQALRKFFGEVPYYVWVKALP